MIGKLFVDPKIYDENEIVIDYYIVTKLLSKQKYQVSDLKRLVYKKLDNKWDLDATYEYKKETYRGLVLNKNCLEIPWYLDRRRKITIISVDRIFKINYPGDAGPPISTEEVVFQDFLFRCGD